MAPPHHPWSARTAAHAPNLTAKACETDRMQTVVLVEGASDAIAIATLARRRNQDLAGVRIVSLDGVTNASKAMAEFGPSGQNLRMAGLCDAGEERFFRGGLERAGLGPVATREELERLGFFVCVADLEDELIRSLGVNQPFQRDRSPEQQLHRFFGTTSARKAQYARALVDGLDLARVPRPLEALLDRLTQAA
jgi:hypothetical protein